jgi:hypothetical protein
MFNRTLSELQVKLFNQLRTTAFYARLKAVAVEPSSKLPCGWQADVAGDFTAEERDQVDEIVRDLQRRYSCAVDPLRTRPHE